MCSLFYRLATLGKRNYFFVDSLLFQFINFLKFVRLFNYQTSFQFFQIQILILIFDAFPIILPLNLACLVDKCFGLKDLITSQQLTFECIKGQMYYMGSVCNIIPFFCLTISEQILTLKLATSFTTSPEFSFLKQACCFFILLLWLVGIILFMQNLFKLYREFIFFVFNSYQICLHNLYCCFVFANFASCSLIFGNSNSFSIN